VKGLGSVNNFKEPEKTYLLFSAIRYNIFSSVSHIYEKEKFNIQGLQKYPSCETIPLKVLSSQKRGG
jgi:hypothetical protein